MAFYAQDLIIYSGSATGSDGLPSNSRLFFGAGGGSASNASVQMTASANGQGFIAVNANAQGQRSTILRAEYYQLSGDYNMGSITQKGSGSFAILLDADQAKSDAKFVVESNNAVPGLGSRLFHVSESGEVRSHGYLKRLY